MTPVAIIQSFTPNPEAFIQQGRGYVDWKFGQVAAYLGYAGACESVATMRRWYDYEQKYKGKCLLDTSYEAFLEALKNEPQP